jgi:hypothetical protein
MEAKNSSSAKMQRLVPNNYGTKVEPDSIDEKNDFLNRQDMAIGFICLSISPETIHQVYDVSHDSTPNELWRILEVLVGNKEDCMQNFDKIKNVEKPLEDKSSQFEEPSTQVFA